jgi:hypothetical protein
MEENYETISMVITQLTLDALASAKHVSNMDDKIYSANLIHLVRNLLVTVNKTEYIGEDKVSQEIFNHLKDINKTNPESLPSWLNVVLDNDIIELQIETAL